MVGGWRKREAADKPLAGGKNVIVVIQDIDPVTLN
jgi:hypothetical protein